MQTETALPSAEREISRFPCKKRRHMPGSLTTPGCPSTRVSVLDHIAFRYLYSVSTQDIPIAAQWLACALPCPTLHRWPRGHRCTARGRCGSLLLHRVGLSPTYSLPVSRRTEIRTPDPQIRSLMTPITTRSFENPYGRPGIVSGARIAAWRLKRPPTQPEAEHRELTAHSRNLFGTFRRTSMFVV